jgi:hypothetical protein
MTAGDREYTNTMARFDNYMAGEFFGKMLKKLNRWYSKGFVAAKHENSNPPLMCMNLILEREQNERYFFKIWSENKGRTPLKTNYAAVGMGGLGWVYRRQNNHVYLSISNF